jgi:MFS family permease
MMPFMIPLWARLLDRVHVVQFRAIHSWAFVLAAFLTALAVQFHSEWLLYVSAALTGMGFGGGVLAWNLGHLDFAPRGMESQYMGVHATLNGVRGILGPFLAVGLYEWLTAIAPGRNLGAISFWLCAVITLLGGLGFVRLARTLPPGGWRRNQPVETSPPAKAAGS